jgi:hypothetical protein
MENNYYLPLGTKLGGHYKIEKVLGEDDFEILYLAKDSHKRGEFVILKELFFKSYSLREGTEVKTLAKSRIIFEETKKEVMNEVEELLENPSQAEVETYGAFEENNTIYTIMEFINSPSLDGYLKVKREEKPQEHWEVEKRVYSSEEYQAERETPREERIRKDVMDEEIIEPTPKKRVRVEKKEKPKSSLFLNILITTLLICAALGYYAYNMIKKDKTKNRERPTTVVAKEEPQHKSSHLSIEKEDIINDNLEDPKEVEQPEEAEEEQTPNGAAFITDVEAYKKEQEAKRAKEEAKEKAQEEEERKLREEEENRIREEALKNEQNNRESRPNSIDKLLEEESSNHPENDVPSPFKNREENLPLGAVKPNPLGTAIGSKENRNNSLGTPIGEEPKKEERTSSSSSANKQSIKQFLDNFLTISESGTIDEIVSNYDDQVGRYFSLRDVDHETIRQDKINYHKKWNYREFDMLGYEVTKVYKRGGETYYDVKTTTNWSVADGKGKSVAGTSKGVMTLRETENGFKVTSIYTNKSR